MAASLKEEGSIRRQHTKHIAMHNTTQCTKTDATQIDPIKREFAVGMSMCRAVCVAIPSRRHQIQNDIILTVKSNELQSINSNYYS